MVKPAANEQRQVRCDLEIWTRGKCGLRVRSRGHLYLSAFLKLDMTARGEAITELLVNAAKQVEKQVDDLDKRTDAAAEEEN